MSNNEFDEDRIDRVGQNGNEGTHYEKDVVITGGFSDKPCNTAHGFLRRSGDIMEERGKTYDQEGGERSMARTITAFNAITGMDMKESDGWLLMQLLKDSRQWSAPKFHQDSADDCVAYAALKAEALANGV